MDFKEFSTGPDDCNRRLDKVIRIVYPDFNLSEIYKFIRKGLIKVNNKKTTAEYHIQPGDKINIAAFLFQDDNKIPTNDDSVPDKKTLIPPIPTPEIIFKNEHILIIDKPYNVNVHGDDKSLDKFICQYYQQNFENKNSLSFTPGPLHRLDKKTTGLLAFSLSLKGAQWFTENIRTHVITKKYYGLVEGIISSNEKWTDQIDDKTAITNVRPLQSGKYKKMPVTFVEFNIETGRKHQIRIHSSKHNHPLLGDTLYGGKQISECQDYFLQAFELTFPNDNPIGLPEKISISVSKNFSQVLNICDINKTGL